MYATTFIVVLILLLGSAVLVGPRTGEAQRAVKIVRIGLLEAASAAGYAKGHEALSAGLRDLGYVEGKNIVVEYRWGEGNYERLPGLAVELVQMNVDVIVAGGFQAISAAQQATATIPIVMVRTSDPVAARFVASVARPGGNITGLSNINVDVMSKYLELLRVAVPRLSRVSVLMNPGHPSHPGFLKRIQARTKRTA